MPDQDDEAVVGVGNAANADAPDFMPGRVGQFRIARQSPNWSAEGIFFAVAGGRPVATVSGRVDKCRPEPLGFAVVRSSTTFERALG